jgi:hypothetical protein
MQKEYDAIMTNMVKLLEVQQKRELVAVDMIAAAIAAEREACIVDIQMCIPRSGHDTPEMLFAKKVMERIRARGDNK